MYTQVQYTLFIDELLARLSVEFDIDVSRSSVAMVDIYRTGDWLYAGEASTLNTKIWRWGIKRDPVIVYGPKWDDDQTTFERKLENELRVAISRLLEA